MIINTLRRLKKIYQHFSDKKLKKTEHKIREQFLANGQIPWSPGYVAYKMDSISKTISDHNLLENLKENKLPQDFGYRLDERIVEYAWIFSNLKKEKTVFLDAGSTFNYDYILNKEIINQKDKYIYTYYPENQNYIEKRISYVFGDLRTLPFKENFFDEVVCQSTLEHIDMDNSIYGYDLKSSITESDVKKSYEFKKVISELIKVLKTEGTALITFPFGKFENHGFFQQFDEEMLNHITKEMDLFGIYDLTFFRYLPNGWIVSNQEDCKNEESYNPHTKVGFKEDYAAHSRAICCIKFKKTK